MKYGQQLSLLLDKSRDATEQEQKEWQEGDRTWWSERALYFVAVASVVQVVMLGLMMGSFYLIQIGVG